VLHINRFVFSASQHRGRAKRFKLHHEKENEQ